MFLKIKKIKNFFGKIDSKFQLISVTLPSKEKMDHNVKTERRKKSDKAKEKHERNGKYSQKAVRAMEAIKTKKVIIFGTKKPL